MRRFIVGLCCVVVGLQVLIGVPLAVGIAFFSYFGAELLGPTSVEFRISSNAEQPPAAAPVDQSPAAVEQNDSILAAREERGSLLARTVLSENLSAADEQREFVAAFRQVAEDSQATLAVSAPANPLPDLLVSTGMTSEPAEPPGMDADRFAIASLYAMAERDEQAQIYARADQWRNLARVIRGEAGILNSDFSAAAANDSLLAEGQQIHAGGSRAN